MILGIGNDLVDIRRIEKALKRFGARFEHRVFTEAERAQARQRGAATPAFYAKRFAAKEACAKALGVGLGVHAAWKEIEVVSLPTGQPSLRLHGNAQRRLEAMTPQEAVPILHLTLADEYPYAQAIVLISAAKK